MPVFPVHTKSKYQFQEGQIVDYMRHSGDLEPYFMESSNRLITEVKRGKGEWCVCMGWGSGWGGGLELYNVMTPEIISRNSLL